MKEAHGMLTTYLSSGTRIESTDGFFYYRKLMYKVHTGLTQRYEKITEIQIKSTKLAYTGALNGARQLSG